MEASNRCAEGDEAPQEVPTRWNCPCGKGQLPDDGEQLAFCCSGAVSPALQLCEEVRELIWGKADALLCGVELEAQEGEDGRWTFHLLHRDWDTELVAHP